MAKKARKAPKANDGAARARQVATFGNTARNGGGRVWTATDRRKEASRKACRRGGWD